MTFTEAKIQYEEFHMKGNEQTLSGDVICAASLLVFLVLLTGPNAAPSREEPGQGLSASIKALSLKVS